MTWFYETENPYMPTTLPIQTKINQVSKNIRSAPVSETRLRISNIFSVQNHIHTCLICGVEMNKYLRDKHISDFHPNLNEALNEASLVFKNFLLKNSNDN